MPTFVRTSQWGNGSRGSPASHLVVRAHAAGARGGNVIPLAGGNSPGGSSLPLLSRPSARHPSPAHALALGQIALALYLPPAVGIVFRPFQAWDQYLEVFPFMPTFIPTALIMGLDWAARVAFFEPPPELAGVTVVVARVVLSTMNPLAVIGGLGVVAQRQNLVDRLPDHSRSDVGGLHVAHLDNTLGQRVSLSVHQSGPTLAGSNPPSVDYLCYGSTSADKAP